jgi:polyvinyl alcohol dehydrogenase (cytochrome)
MKPLLKFAASILFWPTLSPQAQTLVHTVDYSSAKPEAPGKAVFDGTCAQCHEHGIGGAPLKQMLTYMRPNAVYNVITKGAMQVQASRLTDTERRQVVEYLTGSSPGQSSNAFPLQCKNSDAWFQPNAKAVATGWGIDPTNTRSLNRHSSDLSAKNLSKLRLKWAFAFPDSVDIRSQPVIAGNGLFVGSQSGAVYALDPDTGCVRWTYTGASEVRGGIVYVDAPRPILIFGDVFAYTYALDAPTGALLWKVKVDNHPAARIVGTPAVWQRLVYVPVSSLGEEESAASSDYLCCTFRGSIVALEVLTGKIIWRRYAIPQPAVEQFRDAAGKSRWGPSGAGIWSSPAIDATRGLLYFATGDNYSEPADDNSDAIFAVSLKTGEVQWQHQVLANDAFNDGCYLGRRGPSCPHNPGPDADFTAPPIVVYAKSGRSILLAGQKSGDVFGIDPDSGRILWRRRVSRDPSPLSGGIWWGMAAQDGTLFIPAYSVPDMRLALGTTHAQTAATPRLAADKTDSVDGLYARNVFTGKRQWSAPVKTYCDSKTECFGIQMAPLTIPGSVLAASLEGHIRVFDSRTGGQLWEFDTAQPVKSLNGEFVSGHYIRGAGAIMAAHRMLYVTTNGDRDSVLLAFSLP